MAGIVVRWKGQEIRTYSEQIAIALKIHSTKEAEEFIKAFEKAGVDRKIILSNLGYLAGYCDQKARDHVLKYFGAEHPIFGNKIPTSKEAFGAGTKMAQKKKPNR